MEPRYFIRATDTYSTVDRPMAAPILRRSFELDFEPEKASLTICVSGFYELFVNGRKITKGYLAPYISNPSQCLYYDEYAVEQYLQKGKNAVAVILGNGFANQDTPQQDFCKYEDRAPLVMAMALEADGEEKHFLLESDENFKVQDSPILYDMYRFGVVYDARKEVEGFAEPELDDSEWKCAKAAEAPKGILRRSTARPITEQYRLKPVSIEKQESFCRFHDNDRTPILSTYVEQGWMYDFGYNCAGVCCLKIKGEAGQKIKLHHGEALRDGKFNMNSIVTVNEKIKKFLPLLQTDTYILKGGEEEIYIPSFTYHGFRYVLLEGITEQQATPDLLTYIVFNTDLRRRSEFRCSDPVINQLYDMAIRADLANFQHFPTDCPHREKNGWTGDAAVSACQLLLSFDSAENFRMWFESIRASQLDNGEIPGVVPTCGWGYAWGNGPAWDAVIFNLLYYIYRFDGRKDILQENSDLMLQYLQYIAGRRDKKGLVACGLGDWCQPFSGNVSISSPLAFTDSTQVFEMAERAAVIWDALGQEDRKAYALQLMEEMRQAVRNHLIDWDTMTAAGCCQTSQAVALSMGIFTEEEEGMAYQRLLELIHEKNDLIDCGMIGLRHIFHVLVEHGDADLALRMICREDAPSYGNMIALGGTALFESLIPNGMQESQNHHFYGDIIQLFIAKIAGLQINPQMDDPYHVLIAPQVPETMDFAEASYTFDKVAEDSASCQTVRVRWKKDGEQIVLEANIPPICTAELRWKGKKIALQTGEQRIELKR